MTRQMRTPRTQLVALAAGMACSVALVAPTAAALADDAGTASAKIGKLKGSVGPGFAISINKAKVKAGKYKLIVTDKGTIHNFHITGPGVDEATSVPGTGKSTWKLKLKPGTYTIVCDPHTDSMSTTLTVT